MIRWRDGVYRLIFVEDEINMPSVHLYPLAILLAVVYHIVVDRRSASDLIRRTWKYPTFTLSSYPKRNEGSGTVIATSFIPKMYKEDLVVQSRIFSCVGHCNT